MQGVHTYTQENNSHGRTHSPSTSRMKTEAVSAAALLLFFVTFSFICSVTSVKEWKNYENGKVQSHRKLNHKKVDRKVDMHVESNEQHLLHGNHANKLEPRAEKNIKQSPTSKARENEGKVKKETFDEEHGAKGREAAHKINIKSRKPPTFIKTSKGKNLDTPAKSMKNKQGKKKFPGEKMWTPKNKQTLLRSTTPKKHKSKKQKDEVKSKGHVYGNSKAKSLFNNLPYKTGRKSKTEFMKDEFKLPSPSYPTMW